MLGSVDGSTPVYPNNLALADDGKIYFTEASSKFGADKYRGTYNASLLDIMEHGGHGGVFEFDPEKGTARLLLDDLNYANGIAISDDNRFLVIAETSNYRVLRYWLAGPRQGETDILLENLPGFPDNIKTGAVAASGWGSRRRATRCSTASQTNPGCARSCSDCPQQSDRGPCRRLM